MRRLIICDTLYQIIVGIQLQLTLFKNDETEIWISNHSIGTRKIAERLKTEELFKNVEYIETKEIVYSKVIKDKIKNTFKYGIKGKNIIDNISVFDEILFYNMSLVVYSIFVQYELKQYKCMWSRFEEGIFSYESDGEYGNTVKIVEKIRGVRKYRKLSNSIENYYCFYPKLKETNVYKKIEIPTIKKNIEEIKPILCRVFDYSPMTITQKYILFSSSSDIDGYGFGEFDIIREVVERLGSDNVIIKKHPRDERDVFTKMKVEILGNISVPWELIQICNNLSNNTFISITSGAFINSCVLLEPENKAYMLYPCVTEKNKKYKKTIDRIEKLLKRMNENEIGKMIIVTSKLEDLD